MIKRTYIKILGPPIKKAIDELDKIAIEMPDFCIMNTIISSGIPSSVSRDLGGENIKLGFSRAEFANNYFNRSQVVLNKEQCEQILSGSPSLLGDYDYFFEWNKDFNIKDYDSLLEKIDNSLTPLGCLYSITNR